MANKKYKLSDSDYWEASGVYDITEGKTQREINAAKVPTSRTVNGKALSANITLSSEDIGDDSGAGGANVKASLAALKGSLNALCLKGAKTTINQAGTYSNISCTGLTANHKVVNWGLFSDTNLTTPLDPNNPPADITITEKANAYDIVIANYSTAFYIQPIFALPQN